MSRRLFRAIPYFHTTRPKKVECMVVVDGGCVGIETRAGDRRNENAEPLQDIR